MQFLIQLTGMSSEQREKRGDRQLAEMASLAACDVLRINCVFSKAAVAAQRRGTGRTAAPQSWARALLAVPSFRPALADYWEEMFIERFRFPERVEWTPQQLSVSSCHKAVWSRLAHGKAKAFSKRKFDKWKILGSIAVVSNKRWDFSRKAAEMGTAPKVS